MNLTISQAEELAASVMKAADDVNDRDIMLAPAFTSLPAVSRIVKDSQVILAAQNVCWEESGAFTGEISPAMLQELSCSMVIIGHSERRHIFGEDGPLLKRRLQGCLRHNLTPILCVGETLEEREAGYTFTRLKNQIKEALEGVEIDTAARLIIAYEPVWAIGTGKTASTDQAQEVHLFLRGVLGEILQKDIAAAIRILYGGSVNPDNVDALMAQDDIDGALVGGAALKTKAFERIIRFQQVS